MEPLLKNTPNAGNVIPPRKQDILNFLNCINIGDEPIPFKEPNVHPHNEIQDIQKAIQNSKESGIGCCDVLTMGLLSATLVGICFVCKNTVLINNNQYGFVVKEGKVMFLRPGWHYIGYPFTGDVITHDINSDYIEVNNLKIIRIKNDEVGIGINNTSIEILLPGTHCRIQGSYLFKKRCKLNGDINEGPIKILTVQTGTVCICYDNGVAKILSQGRYSVNSNGFIIGQAIDITQQNIKFKQHKVLLDGGINMIVEGLLTYQIVDVERLIKTVHVERLNSYLEEIMKADLTKVFSTIHLEQISSTTYDEVKKENNSAKDTRFLIYESIMKLIKPQADLWGVNIINFQLESTELADKRYSKQYESASLDIAKSKAELRAQEAQNVILKQKAETASRVALIQAETEKRVLLTKAQANAESTKMQAEANAAALIKEAEAKAQAANMMTSKYGQELALLGQKSKIASSLKFHTLIIGEGNDESSTINKVIPALKHQEK